jgi:hypothetical protein
MKMKLSEAAIAGAPLLVDRAVGQFFAVTDEGLCGCFFGAVALGAGITTSEEVKRVFDTSSVSAFDQRMSEALLDAYPELVGEGLCGNGQRRWSERMWRLIRGFDSSGDTVVEYANRIAKEGL